MLTKNTLSPAPARTAVALGCFDGLHRGHLAVIGAAVARRAEGLLPAVFTFDESPQKELTGKAVPRLMTNSWKEQLLSDYGVELLYNIDFSEVMKLTPPSFVQGVLRDMLHAGAVFCGENYHFGRGGHAGVKELELLCQENGIELQVVPGVASGGRLISSTRIRELVQQGDMEQAAQLLGRPYCFDFPVAHGRRVGRLMGTPTLNQPFPQNFVLPKFGVYASRVYFKDWCMVGVTNVGVRPTVGADGPLAETWMPDYHGEELYGEVVRTELLEFLRPEMKFEGLEQLRAAILENGEQVRRKYG